MSIHDDHRGDSPFAWRERDRQGGRRSNEVEVNRGNSSEHYRLDFDRNEERYENSGAEEGRMERAFDRSSWHSDDAHSNMRSGGSTQNSTLNHRGKGPKNYSADDRLRVEVCERLAHDHELDATDIDVQVSGGEVTLTGSVWGRRDKRLAEDIAESVHGVRDVHNRIAVGTAPSLSSATSTQQESTSAAVSANGTSRTGRVS